MNSLPILVVVTVQFSSAKKSLSTGDYGEASPPITCVSHAHVNPCEGPFLCRIPMHISGFMMRVWREPLLSHLTLSHVYVMQPLVKGVFLTLLSHSSVILLCRTLTEGGEILAQTLHLTLGHVYAMPEVFSSHSSQWGDSYVTYSRTPTGEGVRLAQTLLSAWTTFEPLNVGSCLRHAGGVFVKLIWVVKILHSAWTTFKPLNAEPCSRHATPSKKCLQHTHHILKYLLFQICPFCHQCDS